MVAKAPHGCWIGLSAPFKQWDNTLEVESIEGQGWNKGQIPEGKNRKCSRDQQGWILEALSCDYERQILCNIHGVETKQSVMDKEFNKTRKKRQRRNKKES
eukprot:TRINITY_DN7003_c0_g1_i1.p1 TRINITY_DN7003_c0_g1~~TRINITY_DN7003_c0_g1_i1.p1  ORF type:complete len:101 (-),score=32.39 TRINITY_DN7003_c0_g1_i1:108-410(-)